MKTLKKILFILCLLPLGIQAQVQITLNVNNSPSSKVADWVDNPEVATLIINNLQPELAGTEYKIFATLELEGERIAQTIEESMPIRTLEESSEIIQLSEVISMNYLQFFGNTKKEAFTTGYLSPGHYLLCVSLIKTDGSLLATPKKACASVFITDYHMPELIFPKDISISKDILRGTMFNWSAVTPNPSPEMGLKYIIAITEVQQGQSPAQAFSINRPIIQEEVENITSFNWPTDIETEAGKKYVWSVKPVREDGSAYKNTNDGYVAVATFQTKKELTLDIDDKDRRNKNICECSKKIVPQLSLSNPDSNNIRKLELRGVTALKNALLSQCNINRNNTIIDIRIGWKGEEKPNDTSEAQIYKYKDTDTIPDKIFVRATMLPSNGIKFKNENCEKTFYVDLPKSLKMEPKDDLIFYSNCGGNTKFEFKANKKDVKKDVTTNTFSGKGTVFIKWLNARIAVNFSGVKLNEEREMIDGKVQSEIDEQAPKYPISWVAEGLNNSNWVNNSAKRVTKWIKDKTGKSIPYKSAKKKIKPVKMPLGLNFKQGVDQLAITEMQFTKDKALLNIIAAKSVPQSWNSSVEVVGFLAKKVAFTQSDITTFRRIELVEDIICNNTNSKIDFTVKKPKKNPLGGLSNSGGCYIEWSENGFSKFGLQLECRFSKEWLKPTDGKDKVVAQLATEASDWDNLIFEGSLSPAEIVGTNGMVLSANNISYDMSDIQNSPNIKFPRGYEGDKGNTFRGFYAKEISIKMPKTITESTGQELSINAKDLLIDDMGITLNAEVSSENDSGFGEVSIADLSANINSAKVKIVSSSLAEAGFGGKIKLPISSSSKFDYEAMFHMAEKSNTQKEHITLTINPHREAIEAELFKAKLKLNENTSLTAYLDKDDQKFDLNINGTFSFIEKASVGKLDFNLPGVMVENMKMKYNKSKKQFKFNKGTWSFASPQKNIEGFAFSITDIGFEKLQKKQGEKLRAKLKVKGKLNLAKMIGSSATLGLVGVIKDDFNPEYKKTELDDIRVKADLSVVNIDGQLEFFQNDSMYGDGLHGRFDVNFTPVGMGLASNIYFGKKDDYRYWAVEADATLPKSGIPFLGGLSFRKFGGGAYYNMDFHGGIEFDEEGKMIIDNPKKVNNITRRFTPHKVGKGKLGFMATATIATMGDESNFNSDATIRAEFELGEGLTKLGFTGKGWAGGGIEPESREKAYAKGQLEVDYDFTTSIFNLGSLVTIDKKKDNRDNIIYAKAALNLHINGITGRWFLHMGTPETEESLCTVKVFDIADLYAYFMVGNDQVYPPRKGFTEKFINGYRNAMGEEPNTRALSNAPEVTTGAGIAFGIGWSFSSRFSGRTDTPWYDFIPDISYRGTVMAGAELNLALLKNMGCVGFNGWRARGAVGVYGLAEVTADLPPFSVSTGIRGAAWLMGEFPKPTYAAGKFKAEVKFAGNWYGISPSFEYGELCTSIPTHVKKEEAKRLKREEFLAKLYNSPFLTPQKACRFFSRRPIKIGEPGTPLGIYVGTTTLTLMNDVDCRTATEEEICRSINKLYHHYIDPPKIDTEKANYGGNGSYVPKPNWRSVAVGNELRQRLSKIKTVYGHYDFVNKESCMKCFRDHQNELAKIKEEKKAQREEKLRDKEEANKKADEKILNESLITSITPEENGVSFNNINSTYLDKPICVGFKYQPDKVFMVKVKHKDGTSSMRKYKVLYNLLLKEYDVDQQGNAIMGSGKYVTFKKFVNNFGETCFYHEKTTEIIEYSEANRNFANMLDEDIKKETSAPIEKNDVYTSAVTPIHMTTNATLQNTNMFQYEEDVAGKTIVSGTELVAKDFEDRYNLGVNIKTKELWWKPNKAYEFLIVAKLEVEEVREEYMAGDNPGDPDKIYNVIGWQTISSNHSSRRIYFNTVKR